MVIGDIKMIKNPTLEELELIEQTLKARLSAVQMKISERLSEFPQVRIESWDDLSLYEEGYYAINASPDVVDKIRGITCGSETNMVTLKSGEKVIMEKYFSEKEIASLRRV